MDAIDAIHGRRSIRDYQARQVEHEMIEAIILDAVQAPWTPRSGTDRWLFTVIQGRELLARYGARAKEHARAHRPQVAGYEWADDPRFSVFYNAPVVILISGRQDYSLALEECTRAGQILTISAHARGLGTCWVGSPNLWLQDPAVRAELNVPGGFMPFAAFTLGYPAATPPRPGAAEPRTIWVNS